MSPKTALAICLGEQARPQSRRMPRKTWRLHEAKGTKIRIQRSQSGRMRAPEICTRVLWNLITAVQICTLILLRSGKEGMGICDQNNFWVHKQLGITWITKIKNGTPSLITWGIQWRPQKAYALATWLYYLRYQSLKRRLQRIKLSQKYINSFLWKVAQQKLKDALKDANKIQTLNNIKLIMSAPNKKYLKKQWPHFFWLDKNYQSTDLSSTKPR